MNHKTIAGLAGALILSTAGLAFAAEGTIVVPAGQDMSGARLAQADAGEQKPAAPDAGEPKSGDAAASEAESKDAPSSEGTEAAAKSSGSQDAGGSEAAASGSDGSDGARTVADVSNPEPDADPSADTKAESNEVASFKPNDADEDPGLALDTAEKPVYAYANDKADWYTWRGYKKYGANCLQCHGPDGMGSSFAPNLMDSLQNIDYYEFAGIIVSGQQNKWSSSGNSIMPAWGEDPNVMCSLSAIYVYLRGRTDGVVGRGEPARPDKTDRAEAAKQKEYDCLGF